MPGFDLQDYEPVAARIARFWEDWPTGRIVTRLEDGAPGSFVFVAALYRDDSGEPYATGWAREVDGTGHVNQTSALENCETSAIGRALANAGYSTSKRASREEMTKATERIDAYQAKILSDMLLSVGEYPDEWKAAELPNRANIASLPLQAYPFAKALLERAGRGIGESEADASSEMDAEGAPTGTGSGSASALPDFSALSYRELAKFAAEHGIKASGKHEELIARLEAFAASEETAV
jgi:hypothetical protein